MRGQQKWSLRLERENNSHAPVADRLHFEDFQLPRERVEEPEVLLEHREHSLRVDGGGPLGEALKVREKDLRVVGCRLGVEMGHHQGSVDERWCGAQTVLPRKVTKAQMMPASPRDSAKALLLHIRSGAEAIRERAVTAGKWSAIGRSESE